MDTRPFINPKAPREQTRTRLGIAPDDVVVGTIARLFHMKGHDDLLEIAPALCGEFPQLRFLWVGDGLLRPVFEKRIAEMGLKNRLILTGLVPPDEVPDLTAAMDVLVHPSRREGLARALPQGSLAGCPVIAYDVDGNREALVDEETGFLVPPFDRAKLTQALRVLISDAGLRRSMGDAGRRFALVRFDAKVMVDSLERVYREAAAGATTARPL
jgi:glycosyltransferase involved in cell wall biosynthesis